jgi:small subunit ribosomal protein S2
MTLPTFTLRQLLEAGIHFGHTCRRWNPKMDTYIFGEKNKIHIIDLQKTAPLLKVSMQALHDVAATGGKILFVCTKRQGGDLVKEAAERCGQYYVNHRWLGGMLTNWKTVSNSIGRLKSLEAQLADTESDLTKKEKLKLEREIEKLTNVLGGILEMNGLPDMVVVLDVNRDHIAIAECNKLNIPVIGILDTNSNPDGVTFPVPGNDDAIRSLETYCKLFSESILAGQSQGKGARGVDLGDSETIEEVIAAGSTEETVIEEDPLSKNFEEDQKSSEAPSSEKTENQGE